MSQPTTANDTQNSSTSGTPLQTRNSPQIFQTYGNALNSGYAGMRTGAIPAVINLANQSPTIVSNTHVASPTIDLISRTTQVLGGIAQSGFDVFQFHNTLNDALAQGKLNGYNMADASEMLNALPSDWRSKFATDESGLNDLLSNVGGLVNLAQALWTSAASGNQSSQWTSAATADPITNRTALVKQSQAVQSGWQYGNPQPSFEQQVQTATTQANQGTYKQGMSDNPDNSKIGDLIGLGAGAYKAYNLGQSGLSLLGDSEAATTAGEGVLGYLGAAGEGSLLVDAGVTAAAVGTATGVTEIAAAAVGLAAVGYGIYKLAGGTGNNSVLDAAASTASSTMDWFLDNIP